MSQKIELKLFKHTEIPNVHGKTITLTDLSIPNKNVSNFFLEVLIKSDSNTQVINIYPKLDPYARSNSQLELNKSKENPFTVKGNLIITLKTKNEGLIIKSCELSYTVH